MLKKASSLKGKCRKIICYFVLASAKLRCDKWKWTLKQMKCIKVCRLIVIVSVFLRKFKGYNWYAADKAKVQGDILLKKQEAVLNDLDSLLSVIFEFRFLYLCFLWNIYARTGIRMKQLLENGQQSFLGTCL